MLRKRVRGPRIELWVGVPTFVFVVAVAVVASLKVPVRVPTLSPDNRLEELVRKGPDSYFHHVFDPDGLLGQLGQVDLTLDNFERETSHGVFLAALPQLPRDRPDFTMHAAGTWQPGVDGADNGIILFVFPDDRLVRVEVGYGLESALPDIEVRRLVSSTFVPAARAGDLTAGIEALVPPLLERLRAVPRAEARPRSRLSDILVAAQEIPRRARMVWTVWLGGVVEARLLLSAVAAFLFALLAVLLGRIATSAVMLVRRVAARGDPARLRSVALDLVNSLLRLGQVAVILFVMVVGTSFFFPGTGDFGGAGIDLRW
ncbi:MAG: TPM domain-containing protein [Acidobacteria bacterium]|nr:TPM domain-containing protein [Acidobacteriota bacterium]